MHKSNKNLHIDKMSESREYAKRERKRRGVDMSAIEKLKQARSGQTKAIDNIKVCLN